MRRWASLTLFLVVAASALVVSAEGVEDGGGADLSSQAPKVMSAADFMRRVHRRSAPQLHVAKPQVQKRVKVDRHRKIAHLAKRGLASATRSAEMRKKLKAVREENRRKEKRMSEERQSSMLRLGESMENEGELNIEQLSAAEQARVNLEATSAFPDEAKRMQGLRKKAPKVMSQVRNLQKQHGAMVAQLKRHQQRMKSMEAESEFDLMTNPDAENLDANAEKKLGELRSAEQKLADRLGNAKDKAKKLATRMLREEKLRAVSQKAVVLMKKYKVDYGHKLQDEQKKFKVKALKAAEKTAKKQYNNYVAREKQKLRLDKQSMTKRKAAREARRTKRRAAREVRKAKRRAARKARREERTAAAKKRSALRSKKEALARASFEAKEDARVRAQARIEFNEYKTKFLKEQSEMRSESSQDLGESGPDLGESEETLDWQPLTASKPQEPHSKGMMSVLDELQAKVEAAKLKRKAPEPQPKIITKVVTKIVKVPVKPEPTVFGLD